MKLCSIEGCNKTTTWGKVCQMHYRRFQRYGNYDKTIKGVNSKQNVFIRYALTYNNDECLFWPYARFDTGYGMCHFNGTTTTVHKVICAEAHGDRPFSKAVVRHLCGNGQAGCVNPKHLRWGTYAENGQDCVDHGNSARGAKNYFAKLNEEQAKEIKKRAVAGENYGLLAEEFGVSRSCVSSIKNGSSWHWLKTTS